MPKEYIYVLHKTGANSHYLGLKELLDQEGIGLRYREFSIFGKMFKSVRKLDAASFKKQWINLFFLIGLFFSKNKKIVFGIAPYDSKLKRLLPALKNHLIYYHTSWTCWDKTFQPKRVKSERIYSVWKDFLEHKITHIFAVTYTAKNGLLENYKLNSEAISVVYHSLDGAYTNSFCQKKEPNSFLYVGRFSPEKGIEELISLFKTLPQLNLSLVGDGKLLRVIQDRVKQISNIQFIPKVTDKKKLAEIYSEHQFFVLNAKKTSKWEELFGMVLIEAMSQGCVPIVSNHSGPKEVISSQIGYVFQENNLEECLKKVIISGYDWQKAKKAIEESHRYRLKNSSERWRAILK